MTGNRLYRNTGDTRAAFEDVTESGQGRGVVCFDYDRDGDVDLSVANRRPWIM